MPRYYCDYCDTYLTHDSPSVRKQHNAGYKHKANIRAYYQKFEQEQTQTLLDQKIKAHLGQAVSFQQVGAAYNQHLASFGGRPSLPVIPSPMLPIPGAAPSQLVPGIRPPILPRPVLGAPGYGTAPMMAPIAGNPHATSTLPMQANNLQNPPILNTLATVSGGPSATGSNGVSSGSSAPPSNTAAGSYNYQEAPDRSH